jgi:putative ABC transport system permease protein
MPRARYATPGQAKAAYGDMIEKVSALPGVQAVGLASNLPLADSWTIGFRVEGEPGNAFNIASGAWVSPGYFRAMGIELLRGRAFTVADREGSSPVVVINEAMAQRFWPGQDPLGKRIAWGGWDTWLSVAGVVADVKVASLEAEGRPAVYMSMFQVPYARRDVVLVARTAGDPGGLVPLVRREMGAVDPGLPLYDVQPLEQVVAESLAQRTFSLALLSAFAALALLLAVVGLYGVLAYAVTQRTREIGVRVALGAQSADVLRLVVGEGMRLVLAGLAAGLLGALAATYWMRSLLFGISAIDPLTYCGAAALLGLVALVACLVPARRATKIDPMAALRYE